MMTVTMAMATATAVVTFTETLTAVTADRTRPLTARFAVPSQPRDNEFPNPFTEYRPKKLNDGFSSRRYEGWRR